MDSVNRKAVVSLLYVLEIVQVSMSTYDAIRAFSTGWGNPLELNNIGLYWFDNGIMISLSEFPVSFSSLSDMFRQVNFVCQLFYAWRIRVLSRSTITSLFVVLVRIIYVKS